MIDQPTEVELGSEDVKITSAGTYTLSGELNGSVIVEVTGKGTVELVLDNVTINSGDFAAIYVIEADEVVITLAEGSVNKIKVIKRIMYGRNSFDLLKAKVLFHEEFYCNIN